MKDKALKKELAVIRSNFERLAGAISHHNQGFKGVMARLTVLEQRVAVLENKSIPFGPVVDGPNRDRLKTVNELNEQLSKALQETKDETKIP